MMREEGKMTQRTFVLALVLTVISIPGLLLLLTEPAVHAVDLPSLLEVPPNDDAPDMLLIQLERKRAVRARAERFHLLASEERTEGNQLQAPAGAYGDVTKEEAKEEAPGGAYGDVTKEEAAREQGPAGEYGNVSGEEKAAEGGTYIADPLQGFNKAMFKFNDKLYFWVMKPVTRGYKRAVPESLRIAFSSFYRNLLSPISIVNNFLQLKFKYAGKELARTAINTTMGVGGLRDCAAECFGIQGHDEDFGQTLGFYGAGFGFYLVWPVLGPSSVRDTIGQAGDVVTSPTWYINYPIWAAGAVYTHRQVNNLSFHLGEYESFKKSTLDPYVAMRSAYVQNRRAAIAK